MGNETYNPPRFWWLRRILPVGIIYLLILLGVRIWWGWDADRRLRAAVEKCRAAGEPVLLEDFVRPPIPDEENAAYFLKLAAAAFQLPPGFTDVSEVEAALRSDPQAALASQLIEMNGEVLRLTAAARQRRAADWKVPWRSGWMVTQTLPYLSGMRQLGRFEALVASARHQQGDDAGALEAVGDMLGVGAALAESRGLISNLTSVGVNALADNALERITPTLKVADDRTEAAEGAATREEVQRLIAALVDETVCQTAVKRALQFDRLMQMDAAATVLSGGPGVWSGPLVDSLSLLALGPVWKLDTLYMFEWTTHVADATATATWPAAAAELPLEAQRDSVIDRTTHLLSLTLLPTLERAVQLSFRARAFRRMTATALAIRLYEVAHGRRPTRLDDLVPEYLPAVPRDLYATDDRPISYVPDATSAVLYCISLDGVDDGGHFELKSDGSVDGDAADLVFFLNGDRPRPKTTMRPAATQRTPVEGPTSMQTLPDDNEREESTGDDPHS